MSFELSDFVALILFKSEASFVANLLEMINRGQEASSIIVQACVPYVSLIAYETSLWVERVTEERYFKDIDSILQKRLLFKYGDAKDDRIDSILAHCSMILDESIKQFGNKTGLLSFLYKDVGIYVLDGIEVGSTFTFYRYLFSDRALKGNALQKNQTEQYLSSIGNLLGQHLSCLISVVSQCYPNWKPREYTVPKMPSVYYDFHYSKIKSSITNGQGVAIDDGVLFILSDVYYSLGMLKVLHDSSIIDDLVFLKMNLLTLFHFVSLHKKLISYCFRNESGVVFGETLIDMLSGIFQREERKTIESCKHLRDAFVHYSIPKEYQVRHGSPVKEEKAKHVAESARAGKTLIELSVDIAHIAESIRRNLGNIVGMSAWSQRCL